MTEAENPYRFIISGGGTGGHIFPALSIAQEIVSRYPEAKILFIGALGRMEMTRVPEAGFEIIGLDIAGIQRRLTWRNLLVPIKLVKSVWKAIKILKKFKPKMVIGTGGYASAPIILAARLRKIPVLIQEQNSYAGISNKQVAKYAKSVCVAYPDMQRFFPADRIKITGNPVRKNIIQGHQKRKVAMQRFGFSEQYRTLFIMGGSLGARQINESVIAGIDRLIDAQIQIIWQTGKTYYNEVHRCVKCKDLRRVRIFDFIQQIDEAYVVSDLVISRAGALSISEIAVANLPVILVPSPNVAEDHQVKNATSLAKAGAAVLLPDAKAMEQLVNETIKLIFDVNKCERLKSNIKAFSRPQATEDIVNEIENLLIQCV